MDQNDRTQRAEMPAAPSDSPSRSAEAGRAFLRALWWDARSAARGAARRGADRAAAWFGRRREHASPPARHSRRARTLGPLKLALALGIGGIVALAGILLWTLSEIPLHSTVRMDVQRSIQFESADGTTLARRGPLKLPDAALEAFPDHLVQAVVSVEDRRFFDHWGVDLWGIARAAFRNLRQGRTAEGGSTISQQLVKLVTGDDNRTISRKLREAVLALWLEMHLDKREILARYLNGVYLGAGAYGMPAAARVYFGKAVSDLTLAEAAMLAGLIRAPSRFSPQQDPAVALSRANLVLDLMQEHGAISREEADRARAEPPQVSRRATADTWFTDWAAREALSMPRSLVENVRVRTTLVPALQRAAEEAVSQVLANGGAAQNASQAALVAMRPDGAVLAMVGGRTYRVGEFNRAVQALRQPGSAFKLFVYLAALRNGYSPDDMIDDSPVDVNGWRPANFDGGHRGRMTLTDAFARSSNTAAVRLALEVGVDEVAAAARDLGISSELARMPSLALGTSELTLLELTAAFASVRAGTAPVRPWAIAAIGREDERAMVSLGPPIVPRRRLGTERDAMIEMLAAVVERGTGRRAAMDGFVGGKTGTSQNFRDAWFVGFTEDLVVGVWVGNDDGTPMQEVTGGSLPAEIWKDFVTAATPIAKTAHIALPAIEQETSDHDEMVGAAPADVTPGEGRAEMPEGSAAGARAAICDLRACTAAYASFDPTDCTYQPFQGPRRLCVRGNPAAGRALRAAAGDQSASRPAAASCNIAACAADYRSFRASDCTFQPIDGGPRRLCQR